MGFEKKNIAIRKMTSYYNHENFIFQKKIFGGFNLREKRQKRRK